MTRHLCACVCALIVAGCGPSTGEPTCAEDEHSSGGTAIVHGVARAHDGTPLAGMELTLVRCVRRDLFFRPLEFEATATTDADGRFEFQVPGNWHSDCFKLSVKLGEDVVAMDLGVLRRDVEVPELRLWRGEISGASGGDGVRIQWVDLESSHGYAPTNTRVELTRPDADDFPVWKHYGEAKGGLRVPGRWLEDVTRVTAAVTLRRVDCGAGTTFERRWMTPSADVDVGSAPVIPVSRGAPCTIQPERPVPWTRECPFTSGRFDYYASTGSFLSGAEAESLTIDLGQEKAIRHVVLHNLSMPYAILDEDGEPLFDHQFEILASGDGARFERVAGPFRLADGAAVGCGRNPLSQAMECYSDIGFEEPVRARYFRLAVVQNTPKDHNGQGNPATIQSLAQMSLFE